MFEPLAFLHRLNWRLHGLLAFIPTLSGEWTGNWAIGISLLPRVENELGDWSTCHFIATQSGGSSSFGFAAAFHANHLIIILVLLLLLGRSEIEAFRMSIIICSFGLPTAAAATGTLLITHLVLPTVLLLHVATGYSAEAWFTLPSWLVCFAQLVGLLHSVIWWLVYFACGSMIHGHTQAPIVDQHTRYQSCTIDAWYHWSMDPWSMGIHIPVAAAKVNQPTGQCQLASCLVYFAGTLGNWVILHVHHHLLIWFTCLDAVHAHCYTEQ